MALDVPIPPWLHGPQTDPANAYLQAFHIGSQLSMEQARLQQAQIASEKDAQIRERALEANLERAKQEIANRAAYQAASLGIRQQAVDSAMVRTAQVASREAARFAANQRLTEGLQSGKYKTLAEGLYDNPSVMTAGSINTMLSASQPKTHVGTGGEVVQVQPDGTVKVLREARQTRQPTFTIPLDPSNPFGPKISGPMNDPEIARLYKESQAQAAATASENAAPTNKSFSVLDPSTWFGGQKAATQAPTGPVAPPTAALTPGAPAPIAAQAVDVGGKYEDNTILKHKDGSRWIVREGKAVPFSPEMLPSEEELTNEEDQAATTEEAPTE